MRALPFEPAPLPTPDAPPATLPQRDRRLAILLLLAGVVCVGMGQTVIFSVLPPLARTLGFAEFQVAMIFGTSALLWAIFAPIWGRRSDRIGRKPMILLGLSGFVLSTFAFASMLGLGLEGVVGGVGLYALIIAARSIYGLIGSANPAAAQGYIADRSPPERRAAALSGFSAAFGVGAMAGPALGGLAAHWGPLAPLYIVVSLAAVMVVLIWRFLPERNAPLARPDQKRLKASDARLRPFLICALGYGLINAV
ncbi:MAG: MFS transporter, partial [Parvularculaceae bacterium]|nr:MFS transporter [Parvularculaceae bacterium]